MDWFPKQKAAVSSISDTVGPSVADLGTVAV